MPGTIDQLNFQVILDDKEFDKKVQEDIKLAEKLNTQLSKLLDVKKQVNSVTQADVINNRKAQQILVDNARAQEKITQEKIRTEGVQRKINAQIERATKGYQSQSRILAELKNYALGYLSISGVSKLLSSLVRVTGEFELQKTTLAAMIGDLNKAEGIITRIQGLAVESPFQFKELTTYAKQLSAFSVPAEELYNTTKMLADISAGLGVGMDRIVLAYGQVRSAAFLRGQEVRQFTEAGIPILDELAKQFTELEGRAVSTGEVFDKISARLVPFEMVAKVFKDMTSEGGKFYQMQEVQAETLKGKISNLKDAYEVMLNEIGKNQSENLKGAVDWARKLMENYEDTGKALVELVAAYGVYKAALIGLEVVTNTFDRANHKLIGTLLNAGKALLTNPYVALAASVTAAGLAIYKMATYQTEAEKIQESVTKSHQKFQESLAGEYSMLEALYAKMELYNEGTLENDRAKAQIMRKYAPYIEQLRQEGVEVDNLANIYGHLAEKIKTSLQTRAYESSMQSLDKAYKDAEEKANKMLENSLKSNKNAYNLTEKDKLTLSLYVLGGIDQDTAFEKMSESAKAYFRQYNVFLNNQRSQMQSAKEAYLEGIDEISDAYQTFQKDAETKPVKLTPFVESVQKVLNQFGATEDKKGKFASLWADTKTEYYDYIEKLRKGYEEVKQKIKDVGTTQKANLLDLQKEKEAREAIAKALGISLDKGDYGKGKSAAQKDLENQIDLVKKLQDAYEKLRPYVDDKTLKSTLSKFFPEAKQEWIDSLDFTSVIKSLADELEKYDKDAAERLRNSIGKIGVDSEIDRLKELAKKYKESAKAAGEYFNTLRKWQTEDFNINGKGITFDLSKIISDFNEKINEIELRATKAREVFGNIDLDSEEEVAKVKEIFVKEFGADAWAEFWASYKEKGFSAIRDLADAQKEYEKKVALEKARDLGKKYAKELLKNGSVGLTDLANKTYRQLNNMADEVNELIKKTINEIGKIDSEEYDLTEEEKAKLLMLEETIKELGLSLDVIVDEKTEKMLKDFKAIGSATQEIVASIKEIGGVSEDITLGDQLLDSFSKLGPLIENIIQSGPVGAILAAVQIIVDSFKKTLNGAVENLQKFNDKLKEYRDLVVSINRESYEQIAGTNELGLFEYNTQSIDDFKRDFDEIINQIDMLIKKPQKIFSKLDLSLPEGGFDNTEDYLAFIENLELQFAKLGGRLTKREKAAIKELIDNGKQLSDAAAEQTTYLSNLYSNVADDIADAFITAFKESGEAALDYGEIMEGIATQLMKDVIKKSLLEQVFTDENIKKVSDAISSGDYDKALAEAEGMMQMAEGLLPGLEGAFEVLGKYLDETDNEDVVTAANGIKGVTEDTANLLASYMNAMRADGSQRNTLITQLNGNVQQIYTALNSYIPTLAEYQAQIAANTYDMATSNREILSELRGLITYDGGNGAAVKTYS